MSFEALVHSHGAPSPQLVEKAYRHWEVSRRTAAAQANLPVPKVRPFTIALAREAGTQATLVANEIGRLLGWQVYDHELLEHIAKEMGLRTALLESLDEKRQSFLLETVETFARAPMKSLYGPFVSEFEYTHHLVQTILALGMHGECVIVGRGAAFILPAETTLRVRLVGPVAERIATVSKNLGVSQREAAQRVRTIDHQHVDFVQDHFLKDPVDALNYDLVLNASRLPVVQSAEVIVEMLRRCNQNRQ